MADELLVSALMGKSSTARLLYFAYNTPRFPVFIEKV